MVCMWPIGEREIKLVCVKERERERERESDDVNKGERERALVLSNIESNSDYFISSY